MVLAVRRTLIFGPVVVLALALAGCGPAQSRLDVVSGAAVRMLQAVADKDGALACQLLAPETAADVGKDDPCSQAILEEDLPAPGAVVATELFGQWAQVRLAGDTVFLAHFGDGWKVVAAGCKSRGERPYDCQVQGS
jgi:hypothetical protein